MFAVMPSCTFFFAIGDGTEQTFLVLNGAFNVGSAILIAGLAIWSPISYGNQIEEAGRAQRESFAKIYDFNACTDDQS